MPEDQGSDTTDTGTAAGTGTDTAGTGAGEIQTTTTGQAPAEKTFDEKYVKGLRDEAAAARVAKRELEARVKELETQGMSDEQKRTARLKELEDDNRNLAWKARSAEIKSLAAALGCKKPDLIVRLVEDDTDESDLPKTIAGLKKEHPELFLNTTGSADGGSGADSGSGAGKPNGQGMNALIRAAAGF